MWRQGGDMTVAAAAGFWTAWLRAAAVLGLAVAAAGTGATAPPKVEIVEPFSWYKTDGHCQYNYDALALQPLRFNLTVTCGSRGCGTVLVSRPPRSKAITGCDKACNERITCSLGCTASQALHHVEEGAYQIQAEPSRSYFIIPVTAFNICVNVKDHSDVRFVGNQTTNVSSETGSALLSYVAVGYPRPLTYELACDQQIVASLSVTGSFTLTNLTDGVTRCTVVAYNDRRLNVTKPLAVTIEVVRGKPSTSSSNGSDADSGTPTSLLSTRSFTVQSLTSAEQQFGGDPKDKVLVVATVIPCVVMLLISVVLVGCAIFKRRTEQSVSVSEGAGVNKAQRNPWHAAPIINNSSTTNNYYGDRFEILGPGSSIVVHGGGRLNSGDVVLTRDAEGGGS